MSQHVELIADALTEVHLAGLEDEDVPEALLRALLEQGWQPPAEPEGTHDCALLRPVRTIEQLWAGDRYWTCDCGRWWAFLRYEDKSGERSGEWRCYS